MIENVNDISRVPSGKTKSVLKVEIKGSVIIISLKHGLKLGIFYDSLAGPIILFFGMCNLQLKAKKTVFCFF